MLKGDRTTLKYGLFTVRKDLMNREENSVGFSGAIAQRVAGALSTVDLKQLPEFG